MQAFHNAARRANSTHPQSQVLIEPTEAAIGRAVADAFPFAVGKLPLYGPDNLPTPHYGLFRDDTGESVGSTCKRGYVAHTRDDVATITQAAAAAFSDAGRVRLNARFLDGHRLILGPESGYVRKLGQSADTVSPRLILRAGYDGRAFSAWFGVYRGVCENLEIIRPEGVGVSDSIRHSANMRQRLDSLTDQFRTLAASYDSVVETIERMRSVEVSLREWVATVYPQPADASRAKQAADHKRARRINTRIQRERLRLGEHSADADRVTVWEAFNGLQGYVQHDQTRQGRPDAFKRAILAVDSSHVAKAHELAMAAIAA